MIWSRSFTAALLATSLSLSAAAAPTSLVAWAKGRLQSGLLQKLKAQDGERSKFSRGAQPPRERRARVVSAELSRDQKGRGFMLYEVDVRYGDSWETQLRGCVYEKTGSIYVNIGDEHRPAAFLFGEDVAAVPGACEAAPPAGQS